MQWLWGLGKRGQIDVIIHLSTGQTGSLLPNTGERDSCGQMSVCGPITPLTPGFKNWMIRLPRPIDRSKVELQLFVICRGVRGWCLSFLQEISLFVGFLVTAADVVVLNSAQYRIGGIFFSAGKYKFERLAVIVGGSAAGSRVCRLPERCGCSFHFSAAVFQGKRGQRRILFFDGFPGQAGAAWVFTLRRFFSATGGSSGGFQTSRVYRDVGDYGSSGSSDGSGLRDGAVSAGGDFGKEWFQDRASADLGSFGIGLVWTSGISGAGGCGFREGAFPGSGGEDFRTSGCRGCGLRVDVVPDSSGGYNFFLVSNSLSGLLA